jgi:hypothetical protein
MKLGVKPMSCVPVFLLLLVVRQCFAAFPCSAEWNLPSGKHVGEFTGKFEIPQAPSDGRGFQSYWTAIGAPLIQSCLSYGSSGWYMDNQWWGCKDGWSCHGVGHGGNCSNGAHRYCDQQTRGEFTPGETVSFFYRIKKQVFELEPAGSVTYEMGWTSGGKGATIIGSGPAPSTKVTGGRCEHHNTPVKYPKSQFRTFDLVVKDQQGNKLTPDWDCRTPDPEGIQIKCTNSEIIVTFPDNERILNGTHMV